MIVMVIIGVLASIAIPAYTRTVHAAREAALREDLYEMRRAIDSYTVDKQKAPQTLDDLVTGGYLKEIPKDPITNRSDTWMPVIQIPSMKDIKRKSPPADPNKDV